METDGARGSALEPLHAVVSLALSLLLVLALIGYGQDMVFYLELRLLFRHSSEVSDDLELFLRLFNVQMNASSAELSQVP